MVAVASDGVSRAPPYSGVQQGSPVRFRLRGLYPLRRPFPETSTNAWFCNFPSGRQTGPAGSYNPYVTTPAGCHVTQVWADPVSLATTRGVAFAFLSSGYLDVSVPQLASRLPMCSGGSTRALPRVSFLIRTSADHRLVSTFPRLIAAAHVLHRLSAPRHPPCALTILIHLNTLVSLWSFQGAGAGVQQSCNVRVLAPVTRGSRGRTPGREPVAST
jgi:hypothetical protein